MKDLINLLNKASEAYYKGEEIMSNYEYDKLYEELERKESEAGYSLPGSPTQKVGVEPLKKLEKFSHEYPALSLDKTKDIELLTNTFRKGEETCGHVGEVVMWKMDGSTVQLTYSNGKLLRAVSRGNGIVGSVITHNAHYIHGIPTKIQYTGELTVRGEACMSYQEFSSINESLPEEEQYKNPRNLANATILLTDSQEMKKREIQFFAFNLVNKEDGKPESFTERLDWLKEQGFQIVPYEKTDQLKKTVDQWSKRVESFGYPVDGLVITLDHAVFADNLPGTGKHPHPLAGYALKWEDEAVETVLREIEWSASRTGLLNPIAVFDPVELEGTTVSRASLHNVSTILGMDIKVGDRIKVIKANKIIPQIIENVDKKWEWNHGSLSCEDAKTHSIPTICPICGYEVYVYHTLANGKKTNTVVASCINPECPAKKVKKFVHFAERDCLNIDGLSDNKIKCLVEKGYIKHFSDFWNLDVFRGEITEMEGFGKKSFENIQKACENARTTSFIPFLDGLGIPNIGHGQAKLLYKHYTREENKGRDWFNNFLDDIAIGKDLIFIEGIGPVIQTSIENWWWKLNQHPAEMEDLYKLLRILDFKDGKPTENILLSGKTFVITGDVQHFKNRKELQAKIEDLGGKATGSVTKKTDYLICNELSGSSKCKKAQDLGIPIINEEQFLEMII